MNNNYQVQVNKNHYSHRYSSKYTFGDHWTSGDLVLDFEPRSVLEIGPGQNILSNYLKFLGINIVTFDFDETLEPDILGDITQFNFKANSFDVICAFEVLEHIQYEYFIPLIKKLLDASIKGVVFSVPDVAFVLSLNIKLGIGTRDIVDYFTRFSIPRIFKRKLPSGGQHY